MYSVPLIGAFVLIVVSAVGGESDRPTLKSSRELESALFANYTWKWRPAFVRSQKTIVTAGLYLRDINQVDEKQQTLTIHGGLHLFWNDYRLRWDTRQYEAWYLAASPWRVWRPDWTVYNAYQPIGQGDPATNTPYTYNQAWIYYDGSVSFYTVLTKTVTCSFDYTDWPWDTQTCSMFIGSWTYDLSKLDFQWSKSRPLNVNFEWLGSPTNRTRTSGWRVKTIRLTKQYMREDNGFIDQPPPPPFSGSHLWPLLVAEIVFQRHRPYFVLLEFVPMLVTALLTSACFCLQSEVVAAGVTLANLLVQGSCSWSMANQLPSGGVGRSSRIVTAYGACFGLTSTAFILHLLLHRLRTVAKDSVIVALATSLKSKRWWIRGFRSRGGLAITSFGTDYDEIVELTDDGSSVTNENRPEASMQTAVDAMKKILFVIFAIAYLICFPATLV